MFCPNCGKEVPDGVAFCGGCGTSLAAAAAAPAAPVQPQPAPVAEPAATAQPAPAPAAEAPSAPQPAAAQPAAAQPQPQAQPKQPSDSLPFGQHFKNIFHAAIHPVTGIPEVTKQYDKIGNAIMLAGIVVVILSVVGCLTSLSVDIAQMVKLGKYYYASVPGTILKDIFYPFIYYGIRTFGMAGLFLLAGMIVKEKWSFARLLTVASLAAAPAYLVSALLATYLDLIPYVRFGSLISVTAYLYYIVMLYEGMSAETKLTGNKKAFVLVAVFAVTGVLAGYFSF